MEVLVLVDNRIIQLLLNNQILHHSQIHNPKKIVEVLVLSGESAVGFSWCSLTDVICRIRSRGLGGCLD